VVETAIECRVVTIKTRVLHGVHGMEGWAKDALFRFLQNRFLEKGSGVR
jgi:hypothetical protein